MVQCSVKAFGKRVFNRQLRLPAKSKLKAQQSFDSHEVYGHFICGACPSIWRILPVCFDNWE